MPSDKTPQRLIELQEVPKPVFNSLYLALTVEAGHTHLSYHKGLASDAFVGVKPDWSRIRVLNLSGPTSCVSLRFGCSIATKIDEWDGDQALGHPLAELGLLSGHIYEVLGSNWLQQLQRAPNPGRTDDHRKELRHFVCAFRVNVVQVAARSLQYFEGEAPLQAASTSLWRPKSVSSREGPNNSFKPTPHRGVGHVPTLR